MRLGLVVCTLAVASPMGFASLAPYRPSQQDLIEAQRRMDDIPRLLRGAVVQRTLGVTWLDGGKSFWFVGEDRRRQRTYWRVDCETGTKSPLFDHEIMAQLVGQASNQKLDPKNLNLENFRVGEKPDEFVLRSGGKLRAINLATKIVQDLPEPASPTPRDPALSPDGRRRFQIRQGSIAFDGMPVSQTMGFTHAAWSPNSQHLLAWKLTPGDRRQVSLIAASGSGMRGQLRTRFYDLPGDRLDHFEAYLFDAAARTERKLDLAPIMGGGQPWASPPSVLWSRDGSVAWIEFPHRGYQRQEVVRVEVASGSVKTVIDERMPTFVEQGGLLLRTLSNGDLIWRSERSGWGHLYRIDGATGAVKNAITKGSFVVRNVVHVDEVNESLIVTANGLVNDPAKQDPYFMRAYRVRLDGSDFTEITPSNGNHTFQLSPDGAFVVSTYSTVNDLPVHELRNSSGKLVSVVAKAELVTERKPPIGTIEPFVAMGRDGKTPIWGVVCKPSRFRRDRRYPVIENIYAGPQDSFVPKSYAPYHSMQVLAELGFIVVQIDGMGTRNRGKAFHDVCWKNLGDAGFPDRILWMKALAKKVPQADLNRVGIYGTSAGGQSSTGGLLFHPDFYKVAVSACGCHDNRMDKMWWNEQWMGYPVGPHYAEQSNITHAAKLKGRLLLLVGDLDNNVPPESTYRLAEALMRAQKQFDFFVLPGMGHTDGGAYGERLRRDFFVRWLHGVQPLTWDSLSQ